MGEITGVSQTILRTPQGDPRAVLANCLQASIASALGLGLHEVPHVGGQADWEPAIRRWLRMRGLDWRQVEGIPRGRSIVVGSTSRRTGDHAVVGDCGEIAWDPHPSRAGLLKVGRAYALEPLPPAFVRRG